MAIRLGMVDRPVLVVGAMPEEIAAFTARCRGGRWRGLPVELALTGIGKISAAAATQRAIDRHQPLAVVFTGAAGALDPARRIGEIGIGVAAIDAELDLRPWQPTLRRGELPDGGRLWRSDPRLVAAALAAPVDGLFPAYLATTSVFLDTPGKARFRANLAELTADVDGRARTPDLVEMEGAAVLQVAALAGVPALAIRAVSDAVDGDAATDFSGFLREAIGRSAGVVEAVFDAIARGGLAAGGERIAGSARSG